VQAANEYDGERFASPEYSDETVSGSGSTMVPVGVPGTAPGGGSIAPPAGVSIVPLAGVPSAASAGVSGATPEGVSGATPGGASGATPGGVSSAAHGGVSGVGPGGLSGQVPVGVSREAVGGTSNDTEAVQLKKSVTFIRSVIIVAVAVGAALVLGIILSLVIWCCRSSAARQRRNTTQGNANGRAPDTLYPESVARQDVCSPYGPPPFAGAKSGPMSPYGYQGAPFASLS
jgi:hypothetical protein